MEQAFPSEGQGRIFRCYVGMRTDRYRAKFQNSAQVDFYSIVSGLRRSAVEAEKSHK